MTKPITSCYDDGQKYTEEYRVDGIRHRDPLEGPAYICYDENGEILREIYCVNGQYHRDPLEGPAYICYDENGEITCMGFWFNDKLHNPYGPAWDHCKIDHIEWWFNDVKYTNEVNEYLDKNNIIWQNMTQYDFDIMWTIIL